jgi:flagellar motor switch protein FliN/FliY
MPENETSNNIERLLDVEMNVTVRFGKTEIPLKDIVHYGVGSMIELNRTVDDPVELLVNNFPFAHGEVVVIDGYYGVRVTEIGSPEERSQTLFSNPETEKTTEVE